MLARQFTRDATGMQKGESGPLNNPA